MAIVCWGNLAKSANETDRIEQAIQDYVELHNVNVNAHQIEGSSLYMHRVNEQLDHLADSVKPSHVSDDISFIKQIAMTSNVRVALLDNWTTLGELTLEFESSRVGRILIMAQFYVESEGEGEDFYLRFKVTKGVDVSYYPSATGLIYIEIRQIADGLIGQIILPQVIDLAADDYKIEVQGATDAAAQGNVVKGANPASASKILVISVGTKITEV